MAPRVILESDDVVAFAMIIPELVSLVRLGLVDTYLKPQSRVKRYHDQESVVTYLQIRFKSAVAYSEGGLRYTSEKTIRTFLIAQKHSENVL